ncbi:hypothetical protein HGG72_08395 [Ochrobactrum pecoris]|uniref:Uncharacterized protein n=1 Tax=Brucella pecoris TaxID=867683 RepID=A0AB34YMK4_9HYPH|nr:hypothetical protein [Brucella pecoris]MBB4092447.1 hypothetical protein [Brucella pecoris]NKW80358.1 hypothetical protein [Brucella pecoris]
MKSLSAFAPLPAPAAYRPHMRLTAYGAAFLPSWHGRARDTWVMVFLTDNK